MRTFSQLHRQLARVRSLHQEWTPQRRLEPRASGHLRVADTHTQLLRDTTNQVRATRDESCSDTSLPLPEVCQSMASLYSVMTQILQRSDQHAQRGVCAPRSLGTCPCRDTPPHSSFATASNQSPPPRDAAAPPSRRRRASRWRRGRRIADSDGPVGRLGVEPVRLDSDGLGWLGTRRPLIGPLGPAGPAGTALGRAPESGARRAGAGSSGWARPARSRGPPGPCLS